MAKTLALIFGLIFVLVGLLGFVSNPLVGAGALFEANTGHNLLHLVIGVILLGVAFWAAEQSALWLKVVGVVYFLAALLGFFSGSPLLGFASINGADNWLHLVLGVVLVLAGVYGAEDANAPLPASGAGQPMP